MNKTTIDDLTAFLLLVDEQPDAVALRERSYELLASKPGDTVLDVGCGGGTAIGELLARGVDAVGVDVSEDALAIARQRHPDARFERAAAEELPFADSSVDGYRAEKLYHALPDPAKAAAEAYRIVKPGGRIALLAQDWDAIVIDADDFELTRTMIRATASGQPHPRIARHYGVLLADAGFVDVVLEARIWLTRDPTFALPIVGMHAERAVQAEAVDAGAAEDWLAEQHRRASEDRLVVAMPFFLGAGTKPAAAATAR